MWHTVVGGGWWSLFNSWIDLSVSKHILCSVSIACVVCIVCLIFLDLKATKSVIPLYLHLVKVSRILGFVKRVENAF